MAGRLCGGADKLVNLLKAFSGSAGQRGNIVVFRIVIDLILPGAFLDSGLSEGRVDLYDLPGKLVALSRKAADAD